MDTISHDEVRKLKQLHARVNRQQQGQFLTEGEKMIRELASSGLTIVDILVTEEARRLQQAFIQELASSYPVRCISARSAAFLSTTTTPPGLFAIATLPKTELKQLVSSTSLACLVDVQDPGNVGTMIRTADWFGIDGIIVSGGGADPFHDKVLRSSMGSVFRLPLYVSPHIVSDLQFLQKEGFHVCATDVHGDSSATTVHAKHILIMGNESKGLDKEVLSLADSSVTIPRRGGAESLNVSVSFGIMLYELTRKYDR